MHKAIKFAAPFFAPENKKLLFLGLPAALTIGVLGQIIAGLYFLQPASALSASAKMIMLAVLLAATGLEILAILIMRWYWLTYKALAPQKQLRQEAAVTFIDTFSHPRWIFLEIATPTNELSTAWKLQCYPPANALTLPATEAPAATATVFFNPHQVPFIVVLDRQRYWVKKVSPILPAAADGTSTLSLTPNDPAALSLARRPNLIFWGHALLFTLLVIVSFPLALILLLLRPCHPSNCRHVLRPLARLAAKTWGLKIILEDPAQLFESAPHIIVSNHQASLDLLVGACVAPWRAVSIGKRSLVWIPFVGPIYWLSGNILINRQNPRQALQMLSNLGHKLKTKQRSVWVMPEGTRNQGQGLLPFKKGPFKMAVESKIDVVPVAISSYASLNFNQWSAGAITVKVLPAISTKDLAGTTEDINQVRSAAHHAIKQAGLSA